MDTFDVRKYITENKINEALINEEKDVIDPDAQVVDGEQRAAEEDKEAAAKNIDDNMPEVTVDIKFIEDAIAKPLQDAIKEDKFDLIDKNSLLRTIKAVMKNSFYENEFLSEWDTDISAYGSTLSRIIQVYSQKFLPELNYDIEEHKPYIEELKEIFGYGGSYLGFEKGLNTLKRNGFIYDSSTGDFEPVKK